MTIEFFPEAVKEGERTKRSYGGVQELFKSFILTRGVLKNRSVAAHLIGHQFYIQVVAVF